ncbi:MAG TPA: exonuclease SbcCD subunit D [Anaerolineaceae bacterium]|nr:MAG: Nuclease SbcCD subunit D [Anaerolineae bacterium 49_20]HAE84939.1 exonuclease SbcCD subunit D [Anaerolineaceae bacterium]
MIKLLHFADAHIDIANYGAHDPHTGLPLRVMDFLKSLDTIVDTATEEQVDLVIFAGDAYKDRSPAPTFQREWGRRIMRLSRAKIPTILLTGNHDIAPSQQRAHAIQEFDTLEVPYVHVVYQPALLGPNELDGLPVQVLTIPWITRSGLAALQDAAPTEEKDPNKIIENAIANLIQAAIQDLDPTLPAILAAHASISGAVFGHEQTIKLGRDVLLPPGLVRNPRFDYVALGHIHRFQDLNPGAHPPVVYPGSIERVDFGEAREEKGFVVAEVSKGETHYTWRKLAIRPFLDLAVRLEESDSVRKKLLAALPEEEAMRDAVVRLSITYPNGMEALIDEAELREKAHLAFDFRTSRHPQSDIRARLGESSETESKTPEELLEMYWTLNQVKPEEQQALLALARQILSGEGEEPEN